MKYAWLEDLVKEGQVRPEVAAEIYASCKEAAMSPEMASGLKSMREALLRDFPAAAVGALAGFAGQHAYEKQKAKWAFGNMGKDVEKTRDALIKKPEFKGNEDKFNARLNEIAKFSPAVAGNAAVAERLLKRTLHSGLSDSDVEKLVEMQSRMSVPNYETFKLLSEKQASFVGETLADVVSLVKTAAPDKGRAWSVFSRRILPVLGMSVGVPLAGGVMAGTASAVRGHFEKKQLQKDLEKSFQAAIKASDPDKEPLHQNMEKAREAFNALVHFAPSVALQPQAARGFMSKIVSYNQGMNTADLKDLAEIQKNVQQGKAPGGFLHGLVEGSKVLGLQQAASHPAKELSNVYTKDMLDEMTSQGSGSQWSALGG